MANFSEGHSILIIEENKSSIVETLVTQITMCKIRELKKLTKYIWAPNTKIIFQKLR